jgi:hypothetical protein
MFCYPCYGGFVVPFMKCFIVSLLKGFAMFFYPCYGVFIVPFMECFTVSLLKGFAIPSVEGLLFDMESLLSQFLEILLSLFVVFLMSLLVGHLLLFYQLWSIPCCLFLWGTCCSCLMMVFTLEKLSLSPYDRDQTLEV